ncbi:Growth arrest and DNA damage-inducible protein GADD45 gamma [Bagarius yarrelli]|uniref:Growth arrest and DNA damage-inducible protein GADD45 gamma n=1 Tax=Bagarius yarrelli TaxID=175774 RepID=A0A556VXH9_BAGYA|nr:Growth arrest and DNA damage-inducible protein GADD45 gamma [Bagarius yarrelli]
MTRHAEQRREEKRRGEKRRKKERKGEKRRGEKWREEEKRGEDKREEEKKEKKGGEREERERGRGEKERERQKRRKWDVALQIHFTLIQAFCFDNDINIVHVNNIECLEDLVSDTGTSTSGDTHCVLVTRPSEAAWKDAALAKLAMFCEECRGVCEWVPEVTLPE